MSTSEDDALRVNVVFDESLEIVALREQLQGIREARDLQAKEYERRLGELNHAHARAEASSQHFVPRELHDKTIAVLTEKVDQVATRLTASEGRFGGLNAGWGYLVGALGAAGALAGLLAYFAK